MDKPRDEQINEMMDEQASFYNDEKDGILTELSTIDADLEQTYNELLASILGKKADEITDKDFVGDKFTYLEYISKDSESANKISAAKDKIEQHKEKIKAKMIKLLKYKAELYKSNEKLVKKLKDELSERQQQAGILNEAIASDEKNIKDLKSEIESAQKYIDDEKATFIKNEKAKQNEISALEDAIILKKDDDPTLASDNDNLKKLKTELSSLQEKYYNNKVIEDKKDFITFYSPILTQKDTELNAKRNSLADLHIDAYKAAVERVEKDNEKLYDSIGQDIQDYKNVGIDISPEELKVNNSVSKDPESKTTEQPINNMDEPLPSQGNAQNVQNPGYAVAPQGNVQEATPENASDFQDMDEGLPISLTPKQVANNLKNKILSSSFYERYDLLESGGYDDLTAAMPYLSRRERSAIYKKIKDINYSNTEQDIQKLQGIVDALSKTGVISGFNMNTIFDKDGKFKNFKDMSISNIDALNEFITQIGINKNSIAPTQFAQLFESIAMNVKSKSLAYTLKPKSIASLFKSNRKLNKDEEKANSIYDIYDASCSFRIDPDSKTFTYNNKKATPKKAKQPDKFYQALFEQTNDEISDVPPRQMEEDEPVK